MAKKGLILVGDKGRGMDLASSVMAFMLKKYFNKGSRLGGKG